MSNPPALTLSDELLSILGQYVSRINAQGLLSRSIARAGTNGSTVVDEKNLAQVLQRLEASALLFIPSERRDEFQRRLHGLREQFDGDAAHTVEPQVIPVNAEGDIVVARTRARIMCEGLGGGTVSAHKVATVVSELARNIISYTPGGRIELTPELSPRSITIYATDRGSGIANLSTIMSGTYNSKTGLGLGIAGSKRLADDFQIDTGPGGTTVMARMNL